MLLLTEDQLAVQAAAREVLDAHSTSAQVRAIAASPRGHDEQLWKQTVELGWTALAVPDRLGGLDGSVTDLALVTEAYGRVVQPTLFPQTSAVAWILNRHGQGGVADELLEAISSGEVIATWAVEPSEETNYVPDAHIATHIAMTTATGLVIAPATTVTPVETIDLTRRYAHVELGPSVLELPPVVGRDLYHLAVVLQCAESVGIATKLLEMTVHYTKQREQFGVPIGSFQAIKHRIADMLIEVEGARVAVREAAEAVQAGDDATEAVSVAKSWVGRAACFVATHALQLHGGIGFSWEHDLHLYLRRAKANELLLGTPAWHDERLAARLVAAS